MGFQASETTVLFNGTALKRTLRAKNGWLADFYVWGIFFGVSIQSEHRVSFAWMDLGLVSSAFHLFALSFSLSNAFLLAGLYVVWFGLLFKLEHLYLDMLAVAATFQEILSHAVPDVAHPNAAASKSELSKDHQEGRFYTFLLKSAWTVVIIGVLKLVHYGCGQFIYLITRSALSAYFLQRYVEAGVHVDAFDQRCAVDLDRYCETLILILPHLIVWPFIVTYYMYVNFVALKWKKILLVFGHFFVTSGSLTLLAAKVTAWSAESQRLDGMYRSLMTFFHEKFIDTFIWEASEGTFMSELAVLFKAWKASFTTSIYYKSLLQGVLGITQYSGSLLAYLLVGQLLLSGEQLPGPEGVASFISGQVSLTMMFLYKLEGVTEISECLGKHFGYVRRLEPLLGKSMAFHVVPVGGGGSSDLANHSNNHNNLVVSFNDFELCHKSLLLIRKLNVQFFSDENWFIEGRSGSGKTSLIRAIISSSWAKAAVARPSSSLGSARPSSSSSLALAHHDDVDHHHEGRSKLWFRYSRQEYLSVMNQVTFLPFCQDLRKQLLYPRGPHEYLEATGKALDDVSIKEVMQLVGLEDRLKFVRKPGAFKGKARQAASNMLQPVLIDMENLSPGERQRISMARILVWRPPLVILDEAFCSLDLPTQLKFYGLLCERHISFISTLHSTKPLKGGGGGRAFLGNVKVLQIREDKEVTIKLLN